jgi:hypothetical protein
VPLAITFFLQTTFALTKLMSLVTFLSVSDKIQRPNFSKLRNCSLDTREAAKTTASASASPGGLNF